MHTNRSSCISLPHAQLHAEQHREQEALIIQPPSISRRAIGCDCSSKPNLTLARLFICKLLWSCLEPGGGFQPTQFLCVLIRFSSRKLHYGRMVWCLGGGGGDFYTEHHFKMSIIKREKNRYEGK